VRLGSRNRRRLVVGLWVVAAALVLLVVVGAARGGEAKRGHETKPCTHGASSIGPVEVLDGTVSGSTTPLTEACLP
jgi:hypothetical protein